ncbi:MAG TPA: hypothetical protein VGM90_40405 [Kofleriaceae bacterium]
MSGILDKMTAVARGHEPDLTTPPFPQMLSPEEFAAFLRENPTEVLSLDGDDDFDIDEDDDCPICRVMREQRDAEARR